MRVTAQILLLYGLCIFFGCSKQAPPLVVLALNTDGRLQFDYVGLGVYHYSRNMDSFTFRIEYVEGVPVIKAACVTKLGSSNDVKLVIHSNAKEPYTIQFKGFATNNGDLPEAQTTETIRIPAGEQDVSLEGFIHFTYDFSRR